MPKKYHQKALLTKPTPSVPVALSLSSSRQTVNNGHDESQPSVNDLIRESRKAQNRGHIYHDTFPASNSSPVPPSLRAVLNMPPLPPSPAPRTGIRGPSRMRRTPGPPPPASWTEVSKHAPEGAEIDVANIEWQTARIQQQAGTLPGCELPTQRSLQDLVLRKMASSWRWHTDFDQMYLSELPLKIKQVLLSYLAIFDEAHGPNPLPFLFPDDHEAQDDEEVTRLDLACAIGTWATTEQVKKQIVAGSKTTPKSVQVSKRPSSTVPDSWEDEDQPAATLDTAEQRIIPPLPNPQKYKYLKHLSLALSLGTSGTTASWVGLLSLASRVSTITSLSLAHWPQPTYTPNAAKGRTKMSTGSSSMPQALYGGTNLYSALDDDWREAAGILRSLSRSLYCLTWLDLTGCSEWLRALTWRPHPGDGDAEFQDTTYAADTAICSESGPDWNGSWRNLEKLILAVGWVPGPRGGTSSPTVLRSGTSPDPALLDPHQTPETATRIDRNYGYAPGRTLEMWHQIARVGLNQARDVVRSPNPGLNGAGISPASSYGPGNRDHYHAPPGSPQEWSIADEREKRYHRQEIETYMTAWNTSRVVAAQIQQIRGRARKQYKEGLGGDPGDKDKASGGTSSSGKWIEMDFGPKDGLED